MEITKRNNTITIKKTLKRNETYKFSKSSKSESISFYKKPIVVKGFSNQTVDGGQILVLDYDSVDLSVVTEDYRFLQEIFELAEAFLFKTSKGYHVVCPFKFLPSEIFNMIDITRCDEVYKSMPVKNPYRSYVLRISSKGKKKRPKFLRLIGYPKQNDNGEVSSAHVELIEKLYPNAKYPRGYSRDKIKKVKIQEYETYE